MKNKFKVGDRVKLNTKLLDKRYIGHENEFSWRLIIWYRNTRNKIHEIIEITHNKDKYYVLSCEGHRIFCREYELLPNKPYKRIIRGILNAK